MINYEDLRQRLLEIEEVVSSDVTGRGLVNAYIPGEIEKSANELMKSERVVILTGFCIPDKLIGETDGPPGAASLAYCLEKLNKDVILITDKYSKELLEACANVLEIKAKIIEVPFIDSDKFCVKIIEEIEPTHIIAIERPGKAVDGKNYNMKGIDISEFVASTDAFFCEAKNRNVKTIAIGDGGNELGMGKLRQRIHELVKDGEKICANSSADYVITVPISNWGGYALGAALEAVAEADLLQTENLEILMYEQMKIAGAVDGVTKNNVMTVDGVSMEKNLEILKALNKIRNK